ncbi:2-C-methyl-D-erythritol 4-phosphate cytidylyltransferase [Clostridia bacterium]|nr:2-C-methyl-D-erythritol 4-phosphate cytidylyltransferase [Clostridia bacterium]
MNAGLILAGGSSERLIAYDTPKQFIEVGGRMIISYCLRTFEQCPDIDVICVVADKSWRSQIGNYIFADPGDSRQQSIYNGLLALKASSPNCVVVHDAARPCVTVQNISDYIKAADEYDGSTPYLPVTETIYRSFNAKTIAGTLNRDELLIGQTPECYDFEPYLAANEKYVDMLGDFHGSSELAVKSGMKIALAKGNPDNFKITTNADLEKFKSIINGEQG